MSDFQQFSRSPSGGLVFDRPFLPSFNPDLSTIREENWAVAEETAQQVVLCVHPTLDTEEKRKDVIEYVQRLIRTSLGCEVFPYGSVPLKTYLPDGDIDLTTLSSPAAEETLARDVLAVLQAEEKNPNAEYEVKDTQFIDAEVKLVKCLVQNIVIDISFNQLGGLCTLCFLEQVDRLVAKNHLFKRSIILVKTWCYYESRILGAHHGLISTYAMETLVLYIFHVFHASLDGPLAVLYRFLDYFSKFDWENLCISLKGPVSKSSLPDIVVDMTHSVQNDYMLSEEFLRNCIDMFSVPSRGVETQQRAFPQKHLNIIDPLKDNNNLGRSVNRGNFYRIRSAFRYGARKLGRILMLPRERIADEMKRFFANTLERLGRNGGNIYPSPHFRSFSEEKIQFNSLNLDLENNVLGGDFELDRYYTKINHLPMVSKMSQSMDGIGVSVCHPADETNSRLVNYTFDRSASGWYVSDSVSKYNAPSFHFSESFVKSTKFDHGMLNEEKSPNAIDEKVGIDSLMVEHRDNHLGPCGKVCYYSNNYEGMYSSGSGIMSPDGSISEDLALDFREKDLVDISGSPENSNPLSDLSGDYDSHIRSLLYGQCCHGYALSAPVIPNPPTFVSQFESQRPWSTVRQSMPMKQNSSSHIKENSLNLGQTTNPMSDSAQSKSALCWEEEHKSRGTGTYFPNGCLCRERPSRGRGRNRVHGNQRQFQRNARNIGPAPSVPEKKSFKEGKSHEQLPKAQSPVIRHEKSELPQKFTSSALDNSQSSTFALSLDKLEFGSLGHLSDDNHSQASDTTSGWASTPRLVALEVQNSEPLFGSNHERVGNKSYCLKDEDFPPLTV